MLVEFRSEVSELLRSQDLLPLHQFVPEDVAELPCLVVGPPSASEGSSPRLFDLELNVFVIGRRIGDDDSQFELDTYADRTWLVLDSGHVVTRAVPQLITVSGQSIPAYVLTVTTTAPAPC